MNWLRHSTAQKGNWHPLLNNYVSSRIIADCIYDVLCFVFFLFLPMSMNMSVHIHVNTVKPLILRSAIWIPRIESKLHHGRTWCNFWFNMRNWCQLPFPLHSLHVKYSSSFVTGHINSGRILSHLRWYHPLQQSHSIISPLSSHLSQGSLHTQ